MYKMADEDNVVAFPGTNGPETDSSKEKEVCADDILAAALGQFDDVVLIGIGPGKARCISTMPLQLAVFELSRAIHRIHAQSDHLL